MFQHKSTPMTLSAFNEEASFELIDGFTNNDTIDNNAEKSIDKRSNRATVATTEKATTAFKLDADNQYTYLNIGVLMASHLGMVLIK